MLLTLLAAVLCAPLAMAGPLVIDDFLFPNNPTDAFAVSKTRANGIFVPETDPTALGGTRTVNASGGSGPYGLTGEVGNGLFDLNTLNGGFFLQLRYDGTGKVPLPPTDLTGGGTNTGIRLDFRGIHGGAGTNLGVTIGAYDAQGGGVTIGAGIAQSTTPTSLFVPFAAFGFIHQPFSFTDVNLLLVNISGQQGSDFQLDRIVAANLVPEPSTSLLLAIGAVLLWGARHWRRRR